jgi:hypothetical protein
MSVTRDKLIEARDLISDESRWTRFDYAQDMFGSRIESVHDNSACCWCAYGALSKVSGLEPEECDSSDALEFAANELFEQSVVDVNDLRGHAAILQVFDKAIEEAGSLTPAD